MPGSGESRIRFAVARGSCFESSIVRGLTDFGLRTIVFDPAFPDSEPSADWLIVAASWGGDFDLLRQVEAMLPGHPATLIPVDVLHDRVLIGPMIVAGHAGCSRCLFQQRHDHGLPIARGVRMLQTGSTRAIEACFDPLTRDALIQLVTAFVAECAAIPREQRPTAGISCRFDVNSLEISRRAKVPQAGCDHCAPAVDDTAEGARIELQSRPKRAPDHYRIADAADRYDSLTTMLVDADEGPIRALDHDPDKSSRVVAMASLSIAEPRLVETASGRATRLTSARRTAVLEMLERYGALLPRYKKTTVSGSYAELREHAIDPASLGLFSDADLAQAGHLITPYSPHLQTHWVWAFDLTANRPALVPEQCSYYLAAKARGAANFLADTTSGGALGSCLEEAILFGLFELLERDASMLTWYTGRQPARIVLDDLADPGLRALIARWARAGLELIALDTTTEIGVPCVWVMVINRSGTGFYSASCAAAHANARDALAGAFNELGALVDHSLAEFETERERGLALFENPLSLRGVHGHAQIHAQPESASRIEFLTQGRETITLGEMDERAGFLRTMDLRDDLRALVGRFGAENLSVLVVDQTGRLHAGVGTASVKTIVPGLIPIAFGFPWRRVLNLKRLQTVPEKLGWRCVYPASSGLNPHPHPLW